MAGFFLLVILVICIYTNNKKIEKLEKENYLLKKELRKLKENSDSSEKTLTLENTETHSNTVVSKVEKKTVPKKKVDPKEQKNTSILITGAILIILAAIVFLTSTWNSIPDLLKTLVIILLTGVFLGASKIAKNKFHLEKTSNTFFYMAMAYIPIGLISCSIFGLFGEFLAIYGDGNYIYLTGASVLTAIIYFAFYKTRKSNGLICSSLIAQISAVILFSLIFEYNIKLILINILLYNIFLLFVSENKEIGKIEFIKNIYNGIAYISGFITLMCLEDVSLKVVSILMLLAINYILLYRKKEHTILNSYLFNITIYIFGWYFINSEIINENLRILSQIGYILIVFVTEQLLLRNTKNEYLKKSSMVIAIMNMAIIYFESFGYYSEIFVKPYMVAIIEEVLLLIAFVESKEFGKEILSFLIPSCLIAAGCSFLFEMDTSYHAYIIFAILTFMIGELIKNKKLNNGFFIVSHVFTVITYWTVFLIKPQFLDDVIYFIILLVIYGYSFIKNKNIKFFKYLSYIAGTLCLYSGFCFLELDTGDVTYLIPTIAVICIRILEYKYEFLQDEFSKVFKLIYGAIAYICLNCISFEIAYIKQLVCLAWAGLHFYFVTDSKEKDIFRGLTYISGYCMYIAILDELGIDKYHSFSLIGLTVVALLFAKTIINKYLKDTDNIEYIAFSLIYLIALTSYANEKDGMIYVFALVCLLIYSYTKKYGAVFIVTTLAIIVNALALTREFWLSVPWWIYLLLIGTILIGFAIKNESSENKEKISVGKVVKKLKDNIEK